MSALDDNQDRPIQSETGDDPHLSEFQRLKLEIQDAQRHRSDWRKEAKRAFDFVASRQWSEEDQALLNAQNRPAVTFNRCAPIIKAVCGLEVNNRQGVVYLPRTDGDAGPNELMTNAGKWIRDECNAEDEESEAFRDTAICGEGWTETRMDYDEDPEGKIVKERIDPLEMGVNRGACRANYVDRRLTYRIREMDAEDVRALLGLDDTIIDAALDARWLDTGPTPSDGGEGNKKDYPAHTREGIGGDRGTKPRRRVTVVQCQYWKRVPMHIVATVDDSQVQEMTPEDFDTFKSRADALEIEYKAARTFKKVYYECFLGQGMLGAPQEMEMGQFQFNCMTGERDRTKKCFYGMLRDMFDPQMWANKWLSQTMNVMNTNAKGGLLAETDAFVNQRKAQRDWADNTKIVWVKPGTLQKQKIKERTAPALPPGLSELMMFAISSIRDVTGVNLELLGQADREQAASLEAQRRQSAMTVLASLFDSLRRYRKIDGRLMLKFIALLPEGTLIRVVDKGQYRYIPLVKQGVDFTKFDTIIDQAPTSPDQKQFVWAITAQILQLNILPPAAVIELLKYSPYPESVVAEIRKALGMDGQETHEQTSEKLKQAEGALQVMEQQLKEATEKAKTAEDDRAVEMLQLEVEEYKAETDRLKAQWDAKIKAAGEIANAAELDTQVTTGAQQLGGEQAQSAAPAQGGGELAGVNQKIDQLGEMLAQLMQAIVPQQQQAEPALPSEAAPPMPEANLEQM